MVDRRAVHLMQAGRYGSPEHDESGLTRNTLKPDRRLPSFSFRGDDHGNRPRRCADDSSLVHAKTHHGQGGHVVNEVGPFECHPPAAERPHWLDRGNARARCHKWVLCIRLVW